ncbi:tRNA (N6-threonylcarbamoyladenosine(37)-N6)-methyltransferase TrmO [Agaribacterium sp. ZY112]|uniref:tRNA (N6-threonylcarbamoyladenosine(37)-N6)-methyltransferase TrmO n=1 Tax=Agaribacterium sp. ZY112 TaxID=3233574 RepID=UPI0035262036
MSHTYQMQSIGIVHSCFKEKFGIPRQPGLASEAKATLELLAPYNRPECVEGLMTASHLWLQFVFHAVPENNWKPTVRPPRLGGNKRMGVFATRSPVRPNRLGLSVVKLEGIDTSKGVTLLLSGLDLLDGTPVVDIKPYVPYVDARKDATNDFAETEPELLAVRFSEAAQEQVTQLQISYDKNTHGQQAINLQRLIEQVLQQDPRPKYQALDEERVYGMHLLNFNLRWLYKADVQGVYIEVLELLE